jgi:hypothetical protein
MPLLLLLLLLYNKALETNDHLPVVLGLALAAAACLSKASTDDCRRETVSSRTSASIATGLGAPQESSLVVSAAAVRLPHSLLIALLAFLSDAA